MQKLNIIIYGPSGVGKTTIINEILKKQPEIKLSISFTTRDQRPGEKNAQEYNFISKKQFQDLIKQEKLLEYKEIFGNLYGTPNSGAAAMNIFNINIHGVKALQQTSTPSLTILLIPPCHNTLKTRLLNRGDKNLKRLENNCDEINEFVLADFILVNSNIQTTTEHILYLIKCKYQTLTNQNLCKQLISLSP